MYVIMKGSFEIFESGNLFILKNRFLFILEREKEGGREEGREMKHRSQPSDHGPASLSSPHSHSAWRLFEASLRNPTTQRTTI